MKTSGGFEDPITSSALYDILVQVTFTSRFYDTNHVAIWRDAGENMNHTSVWWSTVYATQNRTAIEYYHDAMGSPDHTGAVPAVSWWKVGDDVLGMSEWPSGRIIDPHTMEQVGGFPYSDTDFLEGFGSLHRSSMSPAFLNGFLYFSISILSNPKCGPRAVRARWDGLELGRC